MNKVLDKIPIWAFTLVLMVASMLASVFSSSASSAMLTAYMSPTAAAVFFVVFVGVAYGAIARLVIRLVYGVGDRLFFRMTRTVPDYNLRRLPVDYNSFVRCVVFWLIVAKLLEALFESLLTYVFPVAYYLWQFLSSLCALGCLVAAYFTIDRAFVPAWQSGKCFVSLAIPSVILFAIMVIL